MNEVADHYTRDDLLASIRRGVTMLGKTTETVTIDDLAPVDEFHVGGRVARRDFLDQVAISAEDHVLDLGCGIGGASRFAARSRSCGGCADRLCFGRVTEEVCVDQQAVSDEQRPKSRSDDQPCPSCRVQPAMFHIGLYAWINWCAFPWITATL